LGKDENDSWRWGTSEESGSKLYSLVVFDSRVTPGVDSNIDSQSSLVLDALAIIFSTPDDFFDFQSRFKSCSIWYIAIAATPPTDCPRFLPDRIVSPQV
jgi:hypothetical protein